MSLQRIVLFSIFLTVTHALSSQDIQLSQYYNAPLSLNPALAGSMNKNYRINGNFRNQRSQVLRGDAYNVYNLSVDRKVTLKNGDALGIGLNGFADRAGELNFGTTQGQLSFAYHKQLGTDTITKHTISFAAEYGIVERKVNLTSARWPPQHNGNLSPCELCFAPEFLHSDISIGLNWRSTLSNSFSFSIGGAIRHINQPNVSYNGQGDATLNQRYTLHAEVEWQAGRITSIIPRLLYFNQGGYTQTIPGLELGFDLGKPVLYVGHYLRTHSAVENGLTTNAFITTFSMAFNVFSFGLSYDAPINNLNQAGSSNGAFELTTGVVF